MLQCEEIEPLAQLVVPLCLVGALLVQGGDVTVHPRQIFMHGDAELGYDGVGLVVPEWVGGGGGGWWWLMGDAWWVVVGGDWWMVGTGAAGEGGGARWEVRSGRCEVDVRGGWTY